MPLARDQLRELLEGAFQAGIEALADGLADAIEPTGPVRMVPPAELLVDPRRFQFRVSTINLSGTDGRLKDACKWNPALAGVLLVWPLRDGRLALVDGHHRHRLAISNQVAAVAVLVIEAGDAVEARTIGAVSNLANGTATAVDVAKLLRDQGLGAADLERYGVSRRSRVLADAAALAPLDAPLFARVATGELALEMGLALAAAGPPAHQKALAKEAARRNWTAEQVLEAGKLSRMATITGNSPDGCLPGLEALLEAENSNLGELLAVRAAIRRQLGHELRALTTVATRRSATALEDRNVALVDLAAAAGERDSARAITRLFDHLAGHSGPLQEVIRDLAREVTPKRSAGEVVAQQIERVRRALEQELGCFSDAL